MPCIPLSPIDHRMGTWPLLCIAELGNFYVNSTSDTIDWLQNAKGTQKIPSSATALRGLRVISSMHVYMNEYVIAGCVAYEEYRQLAVCATSLWLMIVGVNHHVIALGNFLTCHHPASILVLHRRAVRIKKLSECSHLWQECQFDFGLMAYFCIDLYQAIRVCYVRFERVSLHKCWDIWQTCLSLPMLLLTCQCKSGMRYNQISIFVRTWQVWWLEFRCKGLDLSGTWQCF